MKHLKKFETLNQVSNPDRIEKTRSEIEYWFITTFNSEEDFNTWCMEMNDVDDVDDVQFDNIIGYDIPMELGIATYDDHGEVISDVLAEIDLDYENYKDLRSGEVTYEEWIETNKYNL